MSLFELHIELELKRLLTYPYTIHNLEPTLILWNFFLNFDLRVSR